MARFQIDEDLRDDVAGLIEALLEERGESEQIPQDAQACWELYRRLVIERGPSRPSQDFIDDEDEMLGDVVGDLDILNARKLEAQFPVGNGGVSICRKSPVEVRVDCITHVAHPSAYGIFDASVDSIENDIFTLAGTRLRADLQFAIGNGSPDLGPDELIMTFAGNLRAVYIVHVPQPLRWDEDEIASLYDKTLELVRVHDCRKYAMPLLSSGTEWFEAASETELATSRVKAFLDKGQAPLTHVLLMAANDMEAEAMECACRSLLA